MMARRPWEREQPLLQIHTSILPQQEKPVPELALAYRIQERGPLQPFLRIEVGGGSLHSSGLAFQRPIHMGDKLYKDCSAATTESSRVEKALNYR